MLSISGFVKVVFISFVSIVLGACAASKSGKINVDENGYAVKGYDVVSYYNVGEAVEGKEKFIHVHEGVKYKFANDNNLEAFRSSPTDYLPAYGGFCAFGVTQNKKIDIDPNAWKIVDKKLYLNYTLPTQRVWEYDIPGNIKVADEIWPNLKSQD